jgi:uncharacterized protein YdeI (YjbR/CyaY-like superfamily)
VAGELPVIGFASREQWRRWLAEHHESSDGVRVKMARKATGLRTVTLAEAVEVALCYGWIDGQGKRLDDEFWTVRFTPRRPRSRWSRINRDRALELIDRGEMQPAGMREIERAQADGRWDAAYEPASTAAVPDDLQRALDAEPRARETFAALDSRNRYAVLHRIAEARRPETRARRIEKHVAMLAEGRSPYPRAGNRGTASPP